MCDAISSRKGEALVDFIDAHHHLQDLTHNLYPWLSRPGATGPMSGDLSGLRRNYLVSDLRRDLGAVKLVKSVHIQHGWNPNDPVGETRWLETQACAAGLPTGIVGFADLASPKVGDLLEAHAMYDRVRGIRQILKWHPDPTLSFAGRPDLVDDVDWRRGYALLRQFDMSFDAQVFPSQLPGLARLAADFPETPLILGHAGVPSDRSSEGMALWSQGMAMLSERPNVFVKLSGFGVFGGAGWSPEWVEGILLRVIEMFGPSRCMCGSNLPVEALYAPPHAITDMLYRLAWRSTPEEAALLLRGTAERIYRI